MNNIIEWKFLWMFACWREVFPMHGWMLRWTFYHACCMRCLHAERNKLVKASYLYIEDDKDFFCVFWDFFRWHSPLIMQWQDDLMMILQSVYLTHALIQWFGCLIVNTSLRWNHSTTCLISEGHPSCIHNIFCMYVRHTYWNHSPYMAHR